MKIIAKLADMIREELNDAEEYAKCAVLNKETDERLADMFYSLSKQELEHANLEHEQAVRLIKDSDQEAPAAMLAVWEWEHEHMVDHIARIKALLNEYKL